VIFGPEAATLGKSHFWLKFNQTTDLINQHQNEDVGLAE
jgi:hypothetical protein